MYSHLNFFFFFLQCSCGREVKFKCICLHRWKINCAIGPERVVPFSETEPCCSERFRPRGGSIPPARRLSEAFNLSVITSAGSTDGLWVSWAPVLCILVFIAVYINRCTVDAHDSVSHNQALRQDGTFWLIQQMLLLLVKLCYSYTYFVKGGQIFEHGGCTWCFIVKTKTCMHCIIAEKTIALVIKCGSARLRGYLREVTQEKTKLLSVRLRSSILVNGHILNPR